jgi:hypothetical protein
MKGSISCYKRLQLIHPTITRWKPFIVVVCVHHDACPEHPKIRQAGGITRVHSGLLKNWE